MLVEIVLTITLIIVSAIGGFIFLASDNGTERMLGVVLTYGVIQLVGDLITLIWG